ncbi:P-loop containing nucleoside triphosphate hydrolase protein [Neohortaea acidophila]|uniref:P-loop containing nucleoside triphosphate hydrolase protein n=1 Tax=Neohortaea acidophila TaxID=245834 RepID=A0A6A6PG77_9PEZI|nr:P-loop containing nucleoside triphosphate hydrolase protein [Neohortaea acidophila]KAF2478969.1 P-loop containing nucleoside triphosphate hydrolase protein [Neohortaea acidophila]
MTESKALIVGISGVSSSGKTTLARLLRDIFPNSFVLHEDDFYKPDAEIPVNEAAGGVADWDCLEAINLPQFEKALSHIREHGMPPPDLVSKEDKNSVGQVDVDRIVVDDLEWKAGRWMFEDVPPIAIIDGFLMYAEGMKEVRSLFDVKLLLRTDYQTAKARREARSGYVTLEGFWEDPPGYVDKVVWPNYVKDHAFLFKDGDVEGEPKQDLLEQLNIQAMPPATQGSMTEVLKWAFDVLEAALSPRDR